MKEILKLEHIQKYYGNQGNITKAIKDISFFVNSGEFVGIMGASGSGKTTLLNCISTIDTVSAGHIYLNGIDITEMKEKELARFRRNNLGFIFQDFNLLDTLTISENIALALTINHVPANQIEDKVKLAIGNGTINQYLMFILADLIFIICSIIYLASHFLEMWKEISPTNKYKGNNLFFFGQIITKLNTTSKSMTLICLTIMLSFFLFIVAPVLVGWSEGYLKVRSLYDIQISSQYNDVYEEAELPTGDYSLVSEFLVENGIETHYDLVYNLYLPNRIDFHSRSKYNFPIVAISLSDYNMIRQMCGYSSITLKENEFTTQWQTIATKEEQNDFLASHTEIVIDNGNLNLSKKCCYTEPLGESLYNTYTDVVYIFPDAVCKSLLPVIRNRYIQTVEVIPYDKAIMLEDYFMEEYPEEGEGMHYSIRTRTEQINSNKASNFILQTSMIYGAVVLLVICLTILSLQQLMDAPQSKYRFGILRKMGVEEQDIEKLILKQLVVWFGLPIITALVISSIVITYFFHMISVQILAYVGFRVLFMQIGMIFFILLSLLICYFMITWTLFKKSIS